MRNVTCEAITDCIEQLCIEACTFLPADVAECLKKAEAAEPSPAGRGALSDIIENYTYAAQARLPICQDTGMAVVFARIGQDVHVTGGDFNAAVTEGVRRGYVNGYLRKSVVADPLRRVNTEDNTPAVIYTEIVPGDKLTLTVAPKGFGSENMSALRIFLPSCSPSDIEDFIVETVRSAGANPCPPVIVGVGLGGTVDKAALLAKQALIRPLDVPNPDPYYLEMEQRVLAKINALGIGPQGYGGRCTALAVSIEPFASHIAGLPCVVNMGCHATRHASAEL